MRSVWTIARMTFLEARRNRIMWSLVFFCVVLLLTSFLFQEVTITAYDRILRDVGLATIDIFGLLISVFLGVSVVTREVERRTVYSILSKPLGRAQYLMGKLAGVWLTILVSLGLMLAAFIFELFLFDSVIGAVVLQAFWLMMMEFLVLASFSILASTFTSSIMSAFMSAGLFLIGHLSSDLYYFGHRSKSAFLQKVGTAIYYLLPDLEKLNLKTEVSLFRHVSATQVASSTGYALIYAAVFLALSVAIFSRRDLK